MFCFITIAQKNDFMIIPSIILKFLSIATILTHPTSIAYNLNSATNLALTTPTNLNSLRSLQNITNYDGQSESDLLNNISTSDVSIVP